MADKSKNEAAELLKTAAKDRMEHEARITEARQALNDALSQEDLEKAIRQAGDAAQLADKTVIETAKALGKNQFRGDIRSVLPTMAKIEKVYGAAPADIADVASAMSNIFNIPEAQISKSLEQLASTGFDFAGSSKLVPEMAQKAVKVGLEGDAGLQATSRLLKVVKLNSAKPEQAMANLNTLLDGLEKSEDLRDIAGQAIKEKKDPVVAILEHIQEKTGGDQKKIAQLFSNTPEAAAVASNALKHIDDYRKLAAENPDGALDKALTEKQAQPGEKLAEIQRRRQNISTDVGKTISPIVSTGATILSDLVGAIEQLNTAVPAAIPGFLAARAFFTALGDQKKDKEKSGKGKAGECCCDGTQLSTTPEAKAAKGGRKATRVKASFDRGAAPSRPSWIRRMGGKLLNPLKGIRMPKLAGMANLGNKLLAPLKAIPLPSLDGMKNLGSRMLAPLKAIKLPKLGLPSLGGIGGKLLGPLKYAASALDLAGALGKGDAKGIGRSAGSILGGMGGQWAGAAAGAALGTMLFPVVGTAIGGIIGGLGGMLLGSSAGEVVGEAVGDSMKAPVQTEAQSLRQPTEANRFAGEIRVTIDGLPPGANASAMSGSDDLRIQVLTGPNAMAY